MAQDIIQIDFARSNGLLVDGILRFPDDRGELEFPPGCFGRKPASARSAESPGWYAYNPQYPDDRWELETFADALGSTLRNLFRESDKMQTGDVYEAEHDGQTYRLRAGHKGVVPVQGFEYDGPRPPRCNA